MVEWLGAEDERTGKKLIERIDRFRARKPRIEHYSCSTREEFLRALRSVGESIAIHGTPILHIESHGALGPDGGIGLDRASSEFLSWAELRAPLLEINLASSFNLIVFMAACFGDGILWQIANETEATPAIGFVGFRKQVDPSTLLNATVEFYRSLFVEDLNIDAAIDRVREQSLTPQIENLHAESSRSLLIASIRGIVKSELPYSLDDGTLVEACKRVEALMFAYARFPQNRVRFAIDMGSVFFEAASGGNL